jgi:hypothetical protein
VSDDRRQYQRLHIGKPLDGWFGDFDVRLVDVSATGALIEHDDAIPDESRALLRFFWRDQEIEILAETARRDADSRTGLRFLEDNYLLRELIADCAREVLRAQQANADGDRAANVFAGDQTLTAASSIAAFGFVTYTLKDGQWRKRAALTADQPEHGFTIAAGEAQEQIELLCETYASGDGEARRLTKLLAELSVAAAR